MADQTDYEHSGMQEVANALREDSMGHAHKRKRDPESADDTRRPNNKRISPGDQDFKPTNDSLQDYGMHHHQGLSHQNGTDHSDAPSTAAAALAGLYPTMSIPQPTEVSFAPQGSDGDRGQETSFMGDSQQGDQSFMDNSTQGQSSGSRGAKPLVGSDEWHKVRKDNHKEGRLMFMTPPHRC